MRVAQVNVVGAAARCFAFDLNAASQLPEALPQPGEGVMAPYWHWAKGRDGTNPT